jgi:hypothetical protein
VFQLNNPSKLLSRMIKLFFNKKPSAKECFNKNEDLGNIYEKKKNNYKLHALGNLIKIKGVYFCRLQKEKLELIEVNEEINSSKIIIK